MPGAGAAVRADMCLVYARALQVYLGYIDCQKPGVSLAYVLVCHSTYSYVTKKNGVRLAYIITNSPMSWHMGFFLQMGQCLVYQWYMAYTTDTPAKNVNDL